MRVHGKHGLWYVRVEAARGFDTTVWREIAGPFAIRREARECAREVYRCLFDARIEMDGRMVVRWRLDPYRVPRRLLCVKGNYDHQDIGEEDGQSN
jgi:hypothetical protein